MFTSNGKIYCKRDTGIHLDSGLIGLVGSHSEFNRGYNDDILGRPSAQRGHSSEPNVNYNEDYFDRRLPPQSSSNREYEEDQRKVRFRNGGRRMPGKDAHTRSSGIRNEGVYDEESSVSSDHGYGGLAGLAKMPQDYLKTPPDYFTTPPPGFMKAPPEFAKSQSHGGYQSHGNQLLNLRSALNEKELQLVELREQHITVLNRAADARQNWEEAHKSKDTVISQLNRKLQHKKSQLDRQEKENQENLHALRKRHKEENVEAEKKELKVSLLEAKNAQFVQELVEQQKLITRMKRHIGDKEKLCARHYQKLEMMNERVQDLKSALQEKEEEAEAQSKYCNELKTLLWKRDAVIAQLQLSEQRLQSHLAREEAAREALAVSRDKVQEEKTLIEKRLSEMQNQFKALKYGSSRNGHQKGHHQSEMKKLVELKDDCSNVQEGALKDLDDREGVLHRIQKRMRELQRSLRSKDNALSDKNNEHQQALQEIQRLTEDYEALKQEYEEVNKRNDELESTLAQMQDYTDGRLGASMSETMTPPVAVEVLPYAFSQGGSTGEDLGMDDAILDSMESEQLSNASVYHANFDKIKIIEVEMPDIDPQQQRQQVQQEKQDDQDDKEQQEHIEQQKPQAPPTQRPHPSFQPLSPRTQTAAPAATSPRGRPAPAVAPSRPLSPPLDLLHNDTGGLSSELDPNYNSIQDEIMKREQCWRKTEELMRAALTRRMKLLEEAKEVHTSEPGVTWSAKTGLELHDRSGHSHNHQHRLQKETNARGISDRNARLERRKQVDENSVDHHIPQRKVSHEDDHNYHGPDSTRGQRQTYDQDIYLGRKINQDVDHFKRVGDVKNRRRHEQEMILDQRKSDGGTTQLEYCKMSEHYDQYERSGRNGRSGRTQKGRFL